MDIKESDEFHCSCPCIDCVEGQFHCGGDYILDDGTLVGMCRHPTYEEVREEYLWDDNDGWDDE